MNCETAIELLPWLLNGTLEAAERQQVQQHLASCAACRQALAETGAAAAIFDWHPPAAELVAVAGGAPATAETEEHVAGCPRCAAELELLRTGRLLVQGAGNVALLHPPDGGAPERQREDRRERAERQVHDDRRERASGRAWRRAALAAGLSGILALGGWLETARVNRALEGRLAAITGSTANTERIASTAPAQPRGTRAAHLGPAIEDAGSFLVLNDRPQRGGEPAVQEVPLSHGMATLLLRTKPHDVYPAYKVEVEHAADRRLVAGPAEVTPKVNDEESVFELTLRGPLPPGDYALILYGVSAAGRRQLDSYALRVTS